MKVGLSINNSCSYSCIPFREIVVLCLVMGIWKRLSSIPIICLNFQSRKAVNPGDGFTPHREGEDHCQWDHWKALSQSPSTLDPYTICRQIFEIFSCCSSGIFISGEVGTPANTGVLAAGISAWRILHLQSNNKSGIRTYRWSVP